MPFGSRVTPHRSAVLPKIKGIDACIAGPVYEFGHRTPSRLDLKHGGVRTIRRHPPSGERPAETEAAFPLLQAANAAPAQNVDYDLHTEVDALVARGTPKDNVVGRTGPPARFWARVHVSIMRDDNRSATQLTIGRPA